MQVTSTTVHNVKTNNDGFTYTDAADATTSAAYNSLGLPVSKTDARGNTTAYTYNKNGWGTGMTTPDGTVRTVTYQIGRDLVVNATKEYAPDYTFTIEQATPDELSTPVLTAVTYDPEATLAGITLPAGWVWADSSIVPTVANSGYVAYYPVDDANYNWMGTDGYVADSHRVERTVSLTVGIAVPDYTLPSGLTAVYGQTLADVTLPAGFTWQDAANTDVGKEQYCKRAGSSD